MSARARPGAPPGPAAPGDAAALLRRLPLFAGLPQADLAALIAGARRIRVPAGGVVMREAGPADGLYVLLSGEVEVTRRGDGDNLLLAVQGPGAVLGEMALLRDGPRSASVRALRDCELLVIAPARLRALLASSPGAALAMLRTVSKRLRSTEASLLQREKMAALGTLSAGLAHELNNPAAAALRGATLLPAALTGWIRRTGDVVERLGAARALPLLASAGAGGGAGAAGSAGAAAEDSVAAWLEERGVAQATELAPVLAEGGWDPAALDALAMEVDAAADLEPVAAWIAATIELHSLAAEIRGGARAISDIVAAVKTYSHLGRAPLQRVDLGASIDNTLVILRGKIGPGIRVLRRVPPELPAIEGYPGELSQLWTNLIDNALDALGSSGTLEIAARPLERGVMVRIIDSGPGIPRRYRNRIFDPFFTTKPPGAGSGLGLSIARSIVVNRHRGRIRARSRPGRTIFEVELPLSPDAPRP